MENSPCYRCSIRKLHCHAQCREYLAFKKRVAEDNKKKTAYKYGKDSLGKKGDWFNGV